MTPDAPVTSDVSSPLDDASGRDARGDASASPVDTDGGACGPRWPGVSDACWSCLCGTCAATTATCGAGCWSVVTCMQQKGCFTGEVLSETACLLFQCGSALGLAPKVGDWDACLIEKGPGFPRRACDEVCGLHEP